jgi:2-(1,2-epoxy-1,2-dihydrophenyl)acetyl-CoA isomerase
MAQNPVLLQREGGVARITLNRPAALNAVDGDMALELARIAREVADDTDVRCVLLDGAGSSFMAGGDIRGFQQMLAMPVADRERRLDELIDAVNAATTALHTMPKPVVAAVRGAAAGFGLSLACACDLVIASETVRFMLAYCQLGASPDGGGSLALTRIVGPRRALAMAMLGDSIGPDEAVALGLASRVVPDAQLDAEAARLAGQLANQATRALGNSKRLVYAALENDRSSQLALEKRSFVELSGSADFAEGVNAFVAKRKPSFTGR